MGVTNWHCISGGFADPWAVLLFIPRTLLVHTMHRDVDMVINSSYEIKQSASPGSATECVSETWQMKVLSLFKLLDPSNLYLIPF